VFNVHRLVLSTQHLAERAMDHEPASAAARVARQSA
jgi:hypothetical protein